MVGLWRSVQVSLAKFKAEARVEQSTPDNDVGIDETNISESNEPVHESDSEEQSSEATPAIEKGRRGTTTRRLGRPFVHEGVFEKSCFQKSSLSRTGDFIPS
jgi:hypothetical protein